MDKRIGSIKGDKRDCAWSKTNRIILDDVCFAVPPPEVNTEA